MFNPIIDLLRSDGSIIMNKSLYFAIGFTESLIYSELVSKYSYFSTREELTEDGYFFCTVQDLELSTGIGEKGQRSAIKKLKNLGLIDNKVKGQPPKRFFKISNDMDILSNLLNEGRMKVKELQEKISVRNDESKNRYTENSQPFPKTLCNPSQSRVNNTKYNNTNIKVYKGLYFTTVEEAVENIDISCIGNIDTVIELASYYLVQYKNKLGKDHIGYSAEQWEEILNTLLENKKELEIDTILGKDVIDRHFDTTYKYEAVYYLHNFKGEVKENRINEVLRYTIE